MTTPSPQVVGLYRYPVKGLSPEALPAVDLKAGETVPCDRMWAIENGPGRFAPQSPKHLPKINFLMLMRDEKLATLTTRYDEGSETLSIHRAGKQVARGQLSSKLGRSMIEQFVAAYMKDSLRGAPKIVFSPGHSFSDVAAKCVHLVNLASLRELERVAGRPLNPLRFRPNIVIDGVPAWAEFGWLGMRIEIGDVQLDGLKRTERCAATNVDPETGARDLAIPALLQRSWGHTDFGIYLKVANDARISVGDAVDAV